MEHVMAGLNSHIDRPIQMPVGVNPDDAGPGVLSGGRFVSNTELERRAAQVAGGLRLLGVGPGAPVAVIARNGLVRLEVAMAWARLGTSVVPLNWHWKADEVRYVLHDSGAKALVGHADLLAALKFSHW